MSSMHHALLLLTTDVVRANIAAVVATDEVQNAVFETFGIADAQQLVKNAYLRPAQAANQLCVVRAQFVTLEAQNALLKVFEEPPHSTRFLLVVPQDFIVIPTLLSRCEIISESTREEANDLFLDFLAASYAERLALIDLAQKQKDTQWQRSIKQGLIAYLKTHTQQLKELEYAARLLLTRGASNKLLFEHAALTLPSSTKQ